MALSGLNLLTPTQKHTCNKLYKFTATAAITMLLSVLIKCFISDHCKSHCIRKKTTPYTIHMDVVLL